MRLTKVTEAGHNLWVVEQDGKEGGVVRAMVKADAQTCRGEIADKLQKARANVRALVDQPPPGQ